MLRVTLSITVHTTHVHCQVTLLCEFLGTQPTHVGPHESMFGTQMSCQSGWPFEATRAHVALQENRTGAGTAASGDSTPPRRHNPAHTHTHTLTEAHPHARPHAHSRLH